MTPRLLALCALVLVGAVLAYVVDRLAGGHPMSLPVLAVLVVVVLAVVVVRERDRRPSP